MSRKLLSRRATAEIMERKAAPGTGRHPSRKAMGAMESRTMARKYPPRRAMALDTRSRAMSRRAMEVTARKGIM